jgi:endogenous inhibitor of DNA gyrase (YacG/DUF329 family)
MAQATLKNCPVCNKLAKVETHPFCSARCANIDLGRWLGGKYAVPTDEQPQDAQHGPEEET